ncbi:MAG: hypothetical protein LKK13_03350 [Bacilli bacterium]|jgi:hypothetical protein|nr:hypothetical protein [Bacilli bacterium]
MKKTLWFGGLALAAGVGLAAGCSLSGIGSDGAIGEEGETALAAESLATFGLVDYAYPSGLNPVKAALQNEVASLSEDRLADVRALLGQMDSIMANYTGISTQTIESAYEEFPNGLEVTYTDAFGESSSYELFYKELVKGDDDITPTEDPTEEASLSPSGEYAYSHEYEWNRQNGNGEGSGSKNGNGRYHYPSEWGKNGSKVSFAYLGGILVDGEDTYDFHATQIEHIRKERTKTHVNFKLYNDSGFYVTANQILMEDDEESLSRIGYAVFDNGECLTSYHLSVVTNGEDEGRIDLSLNGVTFHLQTETVDGTTYIRVRYDDGDESGTLLFEKVLVTDEESGETTVTYELVDE